MNVSPAETDVLTRFRAGLEGLFGSRLAGVVLFGSRARGEGHEDSDLDVLVLIRSLEPRERRQVLDLAFDLELETGLPVSPLVRDPSAWPGPTPIDSEILRDGVTL